jgi:hypothetical protein
MWGIAMYFAVNASYSSSYAFTLPSGHKQFFLVKALIGEAKHLIQDSSLRTPPQKDKPNPLGFAEAYDSVSGDTGGSKVYMVYENGRVYPEYLITFK